MPVGLVVAPADKKMPVPTSTATAVKDDDTDSEGLDCLVANETL